MPGEIHGGRVAGICVRNFAFPAGRKPKLVPIGDDAQGIGIGVCAVPQTVGVNMVLANLLIGGHGTTAVEVIPRATDFLPPDLHLSGFIEKIPGRTDLLSASFHGTIYVEVVPFTVDGLPIVLHLATVVEVVPLATDLLPAGLHPTVTVEVVPFSVNELLAGLHFAT